MSGNQSPPSTSKNRKWLLVATYDNWKKCLQTKSWGVKERYKHTIQRMRVGDEFLVHLTENKTAGICKVTREYYYDTQPTWGDANSYPHRIGFEPIKVPAKPIDAKALYDKHLREKHRTSGGYFGNPIRQISDLEFSVFELDLDKNLDGEKTTQSKENYSVFLTGYDHSNLQISEQNSLLGWGDRPGKLKEKGLQVSWRRRKTN